MVGEPLNQVLHHSVVALLKRLPENVASCILVGTPDGGKPEAVFTVKTEPEEVPPTGEPHRVVIDVYRSKSELSGKAAEIGFRWDPDTDDERELCIPFELDQVDGRVAYATVLRQERWTFFFVSQDAETLYTALTVANSIPSEDRQRLISEVEKTAN